MNTEQQSTCLPIRTLFFMLIWLLLSPPELLVNCRVYTWIHVGFDFLCHVQEEVMYFTLGMAFTMSQKDKEKSATIHEENQTSKTSISPRGLPLKQSSYFTNQDNRPCVRACSAWMGAFGHWLDSGGERQQHCNVRIGTAARSAGPSAHVYTQLVDQVKVPAADIWSDQPQSEPVILASESTTQHPRPGTEHQASGYMISSVIGLTVLHVSTGGGSWEN